MYLGSGENRGDVGSWHDGILHESILNTPFPVTQQKVIND